MLLLTYAFVLANAAVYVPLNSTVGDSIKEKDDIVFFLWSPEQASIKNVSQKGSKTQTAQKTIQKNATESHGQGKKQRHVACHRKGRQPKSINPNKASSTEPQ